MTSLHEADGLTCPRWGASLTDLEGTVAGEGSADEQIRVDVDCPDCAAPLEIVIDSALPDAVRVDVWVEDRRELE